MSDLLRIDGPALENLMPINARQLRKDSNSVLHAIVQPQTRIDGTPSGGIPSSAVGRRETGSSDDLRPWQYSKKTSERDAVALTDRPWYRREPWLLMQLLAFAPIVAAMVLPKTYQLPLFGLGGMLVVVGMVLLVRRELTTSRSRPVEESRAA